MRKTPFYSMIILVGIGFILGVLFADLSHDLQITQDPQTLTNALTYYDIMIEKNKKQPPILLIAIGIIGVSAGCQLVRTKNRTFAVLFLLNVLGILWVYVDVVTTEMKVLAKKDNPDIRGLMTRIKEDHQLMIGLCFSLLLVMFMIVRTDKQEHNPPHKGTDAAKDKVS